MSTDSFPSVEVLFDGYTFNDIAAEKVPGASVLGGTLIDDAVGLNYKTVWGFGTTWVRPLIEEGLTIVSDSAADTPGGIGAEAIGIAYLTDGGTPILTKVILNGVTPVLTPLSQIFRTRGAEVVSAGSTDSNVGTITITGTTSGLNYMAIEPTAGLSQVGVTTIPEGFKAYVHGALVATPSTTKTLHTRIRVGKPGKPMLVRQGFISIDPTDYVHVGLLVDELTDIDVQASISSGSATVCITPVVILLDIAKFRSGQR